MPPKTPANSGRRASPEQSIDALRETNAALVERNSRLVERVSKYDDKFEATSRDLRHAKEEIKRLQAALSEANGAKGTLEMACKQLRYEKESLKNDLKGVKASYESLKLKYDAIPEERKNPMTTPLPDRPKRTAGTASATSGGSGASSRPQLESERGRARRQADNDRLNARFETHRRPPPSNRSSYIEGFGSSRRRSGSAAAPTSRFMYESVAHTRLDDPMVTPRETVAFSTPRRIPSRSGYHSGGSSAVMSDDYEDGDYHIRPIR